MTGLLVLAATPIGDIGDATPRLREALATADVVAAEDTRRLHALLRRLEVTVSGRVVSYFEGNEAARTPELVAELSEGRTVVLVTDAGMPSVSDPGYRLVAAAYAGGLRVTVIPGPSAVLAALAVSGLPTDRFCFEGFLPRKPGPRRSRLAELATEPRTTVFFEAPHRLKAMLADLSKSWGTDREGVVCRELTKTHEQVVRGTLAELAAWAEGEVLGEITVVVTGADEVPTSVPDAVALVRERTARGERASTVIAEVARASGVPRNLLYSAVHDRGGA